MNSKIFIKKSKKNTIEAMYTDRDPKSISDKSKTIDKES